MLATSSPSLSPRRASWLLLAAMLGLLLAGVSLDSLSPSLLLGGSLLLAAIPALWWLLLGDGESQPLPKTILMPGLALLGLQAASLLWTPFPAPAYQTWVETFLLLSLMVVVVQATRSGWGVKPWQDAVILMALVLALLEISLFGLWLTEWQTISLSTGWLPPSGYRASGLLLGHPNVLAGLINLALPLLAVRWFSGRTSSSRPWMLAPAGVLLAGLYLTSSRAGWISGLIGLATTAGLVYLATRSGRVGAWRDIFRGIRPWQLVIGLVLVGLVAGAAYWQLARSGRRPLSRARTAVWSAAVDLIGQAPLTGHGLRAFPVGYAGLPSTYHEEDIPHGHNLLLQVGVESGLAGISALVTLLAGAALVGWRAWRAAPPADQLRLAAYGGAAGACLSHNLFDYLFGPPLYAAAVAFLAGSLLGSQPPAGRSAASPPVRLSLGLGPLALVAIMAFTLAGAWDHWQGALASQSQDWQTAAAALCRANQRQPAEPVAAAGCGLTSQIWALESEAGASPQAMSALQAAATLDPAWGTHAGNLGASLLALGDVGPAIGALDAALAVYPGSADLLLTRGLAAERSGDRAAALTFYRLAVESNPWHLYSAFLQAEAWRTQELSAEELSARLSLVEAQLWAARQALDSGDVRQAQTALDLAEQQTPGSYRLAAFRAEAALLEGSLDEALRLARIALFIDRDQPVSRETYALVLLAHDPEAASRAIVQAAESLVLSSRSQRYQFAAHGRLGPTPDRSPDLVLASASARLVALAQAALSDSGLSLDESDRMVLELLIRHCGCQPDALVLRDASSWVPALAPFPQPEVEGRG